MQKVRSRVAGQVFVLDRAEVAAVLMGVLPEPIRDHFVVIEGRRFPPKQALGVATGLDRADFTTHQARSILRRLGFVAGRLTARPGPGGTPGTDASSGESLRQHVGKWVAVRGADVLVAAEAPADVLAWLERHNQRADSLFRVPVDPSADQAAAVE